MKEVKVTGKKWNGVLGLQHVVISTCKARFLFLLGFLQVRFPFIFVTEVLVLNADFIL